MANFKKLLINGKYFKAQKYTTVKIIFWTDFNLCLFFLFYLYIYSPDSQESDGGALYKVSNYPDLLLKMPRYCSLLEI